MDDYKNAIIRLKVPEWQIGQEVSIYFPDIMYVKAVVEEDCADSAESTTLMSEVCRPVELYVSDYCLTASTKRSFRTVVKEGITKEMQERFPELSFLFSHFAEVYDRKYDKLFDEIEAKLKSCEKEVHSEKAMDTPMDARKMSDLEILTEQWFFGRIDEYSFDAEYNDKCLVEFIESEKKL